MRVVYGFKLEEVFTDKPLAHCHPIFDSFAYFVVRCDSAIVGSLGNLRIAYLVI